MIVSGGGEVVIAFAWCEGVDGLGDGVPEVIDGTSAAFLSKALSLEKGIVKLTTEERE